MKTEFDKIYCINFLESPERRAFMKMQFDALGLDVTFFNAINFKRILEKPYGSSIKDFPVFGCAISHYSIIKEAQLLGYNKILILEDDLCFLKDAAILEHYFNNLPDDWDCIKYFFSLSELAPNLCPKSYLIKELVLYEKFNSIKIDDLFISYNKLPDWFPGSNCATAYALNKNGIDYVVKEYENAFVAADQINGIFSKNKQPNFSLKCYFPNKTICAPHVSFTKGYYDGKTLPTINITALFKFDRNEFFIPEKFLKSTIHNGR